MKRSLVWLSVGAFLVTPVSAVRFGRLAFQFGAEVQGLIVHDTWHTKANSTLQHFDALTSAITNTSAYSYQENGGKLPNYTLGARLTGHANPFEGIFVMMAIGLEGGMKDANGYRPIDPAGDGVAVTDTEWNAQTTTGVAKWTNEKAIVPAIFVGNGTLFLGAEYDVRKFFVTGHDAALKGRLDGFIRDNQWLYGFRAEHAYERDDKKATVFFEFMTNLGRKADEDAEKYFIDLAKYGTDVDFKATPIIASGGALNGAGQLATIGTRARVTAVNTNISKISVGVGMSFVEIREWYD